MVRVVDDITRSLRARLERDKPTFRDAQLIDIARQWKTAIPTFGRITLDVERGKGTLRIREQRVCSGRFRFCRWGEDTKGEPDIGLTTVELLVCPRHAEVPPTVPMASIGLHAVGRFFQRSFETTSDALSADLTEIVRRHKAILDGPWTQGFAVETVNGRWLGEIALTEVAGQSLPMLSVRTFVD